MRISVHPPKSDFYIDIQQVQNFSLMSAQQSLGFGRRLYRYEYAQQQFWLKTHLTAQTVEQQIFADAFENELNCYQIFTAQNAQFLLPSYIQTQASDFPVKMGQFALHVIDADPLFPKQLEGLSRDEIVHRIFLALNVLEELHDLGFIHADLKQSHWRYLQGKAKLIDFEYCHQVGQAQQGMQATPRYMAPELFHGQDKSIQSDLYALGIILLEWLSGLRLQANDYMGWALLHCQQLKPELPDDFLALQPFIKRLLMKQKQQRFMHAQQAKYCLMTEIE